MHNISIATFTQRSESFSTHCPFCGATSFDGENVTSCEHLQLVYQSLEEQPFVFISAKHDNELAGCSDIDEMLALIQSKPAQGTYIGFKEVEEGATPYETMLIFDSLD